MSLIALALLTVMMSVAVIFGWRSWRSRKLYQPLRSVPSPPQHWLLGNVPQISAAIKQKQFFKLLFDWSEQYGPAYVFWVGKPVLILSQPTVVEDTIVRGMRDGSLVRSKRIQKAWNEISSSILLGTSGAEWKWRRKAWNPEFNDSGLAPHTEVVHAACSQITAKLKQADPSKAVQVDPLFVELTMRVIASLLLGIPVERQENSPDGPPLDIQKTYQAMSVIGYRFLRVATGEKIWKKYLPTPASRDYWAARSYLEKLLAPYVDSALERGEKHRGKTEGNLKDSASIKASKPSMLDKIAEKEPRYTRETLIAESIEMLIAGTDTTAHTLSFAVGELASNPNVFKKAQSLVDQVWEQHGELSTDALKDLNYIRAIIKETLRLYSVASGSTSLEATRQTTIQEITVPPGTQISWSMLGAGRDASTYPEPDQFRPERWLEKGKENASVPMIDFGSGYHRCLGEQLAMLEATIMLAQMIHTFEWELVNGKVTLDKLQQNLLIYPTDGMPIRVKRREFEA
ncbi:MAG: cytochrome P450 [Phormidesmis sp.]